MKNAGEAYKYRLYRHIRTSKEIIKKSYLIFPTKIYLGINIIRISRSYMTKYH